MGVPQVSLLELIPWNVLYDGVLEFELAGNAECVGFANDLALVVEAEDEFTLMRNTNIFWVRINSCMKDHNRSLAPEKTEALIMKGRRRMSHVK